MTFPLSRALLDPRLLGAALGDPASWLVWIAVLRAAFGELLTVAELEIFHRLAGGRPPPSKRIRELWLVLGRRSGKSRMAAAIAIYLALFERGRHILAPGEIGHIPIIAASKDQAQTVFNYVLGFLQSSELLAAEIESITADEIRLTGNIIISVHANSFRTSRGRTLLACVFDEVSFWRSEVTVNPDLEVYRAIMPSLVASRGMLIAISSPYRKIGLLHAKHRDHYGVADDDILVVAGTSRDFNPTLDQSLIDKATADDPEASASEWEGLFRRDIASFLADDVIDQAIDRSRPAELPSIPNYTYQAFVDPSGGRHDAMTIAVGHQQQDRYVIDVLRGRKPPFDPHEVVAEYAQLLKDYDLNEVTGDTYSGEWVVSAFRDHNITYNRSEFAKSQLYLESLPLFMRGLVVLPADPTLERELRLLERRTHRSGRDTVDHPRGAHDDHANCVAGVLAGLSAGSDYDSSQNWIGGLNEVFSPFIRHFDDSRITGFLNPEWR